MMITGDYWVSYHDNEDMEQSTSSTMTASNTVLDSSSYCCLAYDENAKPPNYELLYAC